MDKLPVSEKFLGLTLFALVPNITEFMNAISFALYGNIVLSMEIGSAYALQVCLLQIPTMVAFSAWYNHGKEEVAKFTFSLIFPRWDIISVLFSVFLLTYTYQEGKSNYFKGTKTGRADNAKEFSENIESGESKCCHFSNRDCTPNGVAEDEMEFHFEFHWRHVRENNFAVSCFAGGGLAVYGDELYYYAMCTSPDGKTTEAGFHL
ncbi:hypothetical protein G6F56_004234 [Rhizopus delemar]|nr:hypothetical protein G6F56_004234 [Rhizopus delemar]